MEFNLQSNSPKKVGNNSLTSAASNSKFNTPRHSKQHKYKSFNNNGDYSNIANHHYHLSNSTTSLDSNNNIRNHNNKHTNNSNQSNSNNNRSRRSRKPMNNLAPRFQQRAFYSQFHQSGYEPIRRANHMASSSSSSMSGPNFMDNNGHTNQIYYSPHGYHASLLGKRPEPEGAPANNFSNSNYNSMNNSYYGNTTMTTKNPHGNQLDNNNNSSSNDSKVQGNSNNNGSSSSSTSNIKKKHNIDDGGQHQFFERVIFDRIELFSDYGSDNELHDCGKKNESSSQSSSTEVAGEDLTNCSTVSLINHAMRVASDCNKRTALSYAVIGAELDSLHRLHVGRTCTEMQQILSRTGTITDQIDKARGGLRDVAMGVRQVKEDLTKKSSVRRAAAKVKRRRSHQRNSSNKQSPDSNSSYSHTQLNSSQSDISILSEDLNTPRYRVNSQNSECLFSFNSSSSIYENPELSSYCTISRGSMPNTSECPIDRYSQHIRQQSDDVYPDQNHSRSPRTPRNKRQTSIDLLSNSFSSHSLLDS